MDNEMIERVAKAINLRDTTDEYAMARAAIKAMREPTENMKLVGRDNYQHGSATSYSAMIDCIVND